MIRGRPTGAARAQGTAGDGAVIGVDGGGTTTRVGIADSDGRELLRRSGPPGLVDPRDPASGAQRLAALIHEAAAEAGIRLPAASLCAGLAGTGGPAVRAATRDALAGAGVAHRVTVVGDGEIALQGALGDTPGVLLVAGTGSVAHARAKDGRVERCGGWGRFVGDEGSGYAIGRDALTAALRAADGRGDATALLPDLLQVLELGAPEDVPGWVGRADKAAVAALAPRVVAVAAAGDNVAAGIVDAAVEELARHVETLVGRLGPWSPPVPLVLHGGLLRPDGLGPRVEERLRSAPVPIERRDAAADAVSGAIRCALSS